MIILTLGKACVQIRKEWKCRATPMNMSNQRSHWVVKNIWTKAWKEEVATAVMVQKHYWDKKTQKALPFLKSKIVIQLSKSVLMDHDGAYSSVKPILDGLTEAGIIFNDSPKYIELEVKQIKIKQKSEEKTQILINNF